MPWKQVSKHISQDMKKHARVNHDMELDCFFIDFYLDGVYVITERYPGKSRHYAEDAAENYVLGILNVSETA